MTATRTMITGLAAAALALGAVAVGSAPANAAPATVAATCTIQQRADLKTTIHGLHDQIVATRLTPQQRTDRREARRAAIAALKAQARADAGDSATSGRRLTDAQWTELRAKIEALRAADRQERLAIHAKVTALRDQVVAARTQLRACRV